MKPFGSIQALIGRWLDDTAACFMALGERLRKPEHVQLTPHGRSEWRLARGSGPGGGTVLLHVENFRLVADQPLQMSGVHTDVSVSPDQVVVKELELPGRATEFLDGIVSSQMDRLTPWKPDQAIYGFTQPVDIASGRMIVRVAAMPRSAITPLIDALTREGVRSIRIAAPLDDGSQITMYRRSFTGGGIARVRRLALAGLGALAAMLAIAVVADTALGGRIQDRQDRIATEISRQHAALMAARNRILDPETEAERALVQRKNETAADVIVLEALSRALPDRTYLTEMRVEKDKLQISGITDDAPSLIRVLEQSSHFRRAVFFAPTTRGPSDAGYHFHIEAQIVPVFSGW